MIQRSSGALSNILASYENRCAISGVTVPSLLVASHIIPWSVNETRRADPRNGVYLNSLDNKAFDRGLVKFFDDLWVVISPVLRAQSPSQFHQWALLDIEGAGLNLPARFAPDPNDWHSIASTFFRVRNWTNERGLESCPPGHRMVVVPMTTIAATTS